MKTVVDLPGPSIAHHPRQARRTSTFRLGLVVSIVAALAAIVVESLTAVPPVLIVAAVVVIGFTLSWHATGQASREHDAS